MRNRKPADASGGIVSTAILIPSHVVPQAKHTNIKRIAKMIGLVGFLSILYNATIYWNQQINKLSVK